MNANISFEIKAEAFRRMTGYMAPGKDAGMAGESASYAERCHVWGDWLANNEEIITALLEAVETICDV